MLIVKNLSRDFDGKVAVDNLSFELNKGDILGFIGSNGSGKTTTMKMIAGVLEPNKGEIIIDGENINDNPIECKRKTGYLPERSPIYLDMTPCSYLNFIMEVHHLKNQNKIIEEALEICNIQNIKNKKISTLSKGYRQRVSLASIIITDPKLYIFDEPSDGLDPKQRQAIYSLFKNLSLNKAILFSTHNLAEVENLCNKVLVIKDGENEKIYK